MNETKKLYRLDNGVLAGVCGGVAEYFGVDANLVRLIWVLLCFAWSAGFWLYVAAALLLPKKSQVYPGPEHTVFMKPEVLEAFKQEYNWHK